MSSLIAGGSLRALCAALACLVVAVGCERESVLEDVRVLQRAGRIAESLELLAELSEAGNRDPEVHYLYGQSLSAVGRASEAIWPLRAAMESPEWIVPAAGQIARNALQADNFEIALDVLDRALEHDPDDIPTLLLRSVARLRSRRDYEGALRDADRVLELEPSSFQPLPLRAAALLALDRIDEAGELIAVLEEKMGEADVGLGGGLDTALWCATRVTFAAEKGEAEQASKQLEACLEAHPSDPRLIVLAVERFEAQGDFDRAIEILQRTLREMPDARDLRTSLVLRLQARGRGEEAEALLRAATASESVSTAATAWADLGGFLSQTGRLDEAIAAYRGLLELGVEPEPMILFAFGEVLVRAGRYDEARSIVERSPVEAHRHLIDGLAEFKQERYAEALESYTAGSRLWPDNAVARYYSALCAEGLHDIDRAVEEYRYALRIDANATDARLRLARLHLAEGVPEAAALVLGHMPRSGMLRSTPESVMLELEVLARVGRASDALVARLLEERNVDLLPGQIAAALAKGVRSRKGPAAAVQLVARHEDVNWARPGHAPGLRGLVRDLAATGRSEESLALAQRAAAANPKVPEFQSLLATALEQAHAPEVEIEAAYSRLLELEPDDPAGLMYRARIAREHGSDVAALAFLERAVETSPEDLAPHLAWADVLVALARTAEAKAVLEDALIAFPYSGDVALRIVELSKERDAPAAQRTQALAQRAARFGARTSGEPSTGGTDGGR